MGSERPQILDCAVTLIFFINKSLKPQDEFVPATAPVGVVVLEQSNKLLGVVVGIYREHIILVRSGGI